MMKWRPPEGRAKLDRRRSGDAVADIFVSYARADKARVAPLVAALEAQGWSVWWDPEITPGQEFDSQIAAALDAAKAVVVVWTPTSVDSRWVRGEAREAADRGVLAPVRFQGARLPIDARALHTTDLDDWREDVRSRPFEDLRRALTSLIGGKATVAEPAARRRALSICVLPFATMSGDPEQEYFADGISEDIITDLSKVSALSVIARNSAFAFKDRKVDVRQVARELEVSHVLEGSVRKAGNRVRITAQLIDGSTNDHLWAERWDRDLDDIFALQDEISQAIVGALKLKLLPEEKKSIEDRGTTSPEVYDLYLRARAMLNSAVSPGDFGAAVAALRKVLEIDPDFAAVRGDLMHAYIWYTSLAPETREQTFKEYEAIVDDAMARAPDHWATQLAYAGLLMSRRDWAGAETAFGKALATAPSETGIRFRFSSNLTGTGRLKEAVAMLEAARATDPLSAHVSFLLQDTLYVAGRGEDARREYERALSLPGVRDPREHSALQRIWDTGDVELTKAQFHRYLDNQALSIPTLIRVLEHFDEPAEALKVIREGIDEPANQDGMRMMFMAWYAARFGDDDLAAKALRRCFINWANIYPIAIWYPCLARVRQTTDFKQLMRDLGLYDFWRSTGQWGEFARPVGDDDFEIIA
jgi:adenylate cyclase